jgi:hypothetical protein
MLLFTHILRSYDCIVYIILNIEPMGCIIVSINFETILVYKTERYKTVG